MVSTTEHDLELVAAFVNSRDVEGGKDALALPEDLAGWLTQRGLLESGRPVTERDLGRAVAVREAIRALAERNNPGAEVERDGDPAATLNRIARDARLVVQFKPEGGGVLTSLKGGVDGALGRILGAVFVAMAGGAWERFKACASHSCRWAFYDRSRNRSRTWCSMDVCGNREKARAFRERKRAER